MACPAWLSPEAYRLCQAPLEAATCTCWRRGDPLAIPTKGDSAYPDVRIRKVAVPSLRARSLPFDELSTVSLLGVTLVLSV